MDKRQLKKYEQRLRQEYEDLQALLSRNDQESLSGQPDPEDEAERAAHSYAKEFLFTQTDNERTHLRLVEAALGRLQNGEFGLCQSCDKPIERKRLDAVPWTPYCRTCQEMAEDGLLQNRNGESPLE